MKIFAHITTKWDGNKYTGIPVSKLEEYNIDQALDTDANSYTFTIGGQAAELMIPLFNRDTEIRTSITASLRGGPVISLHRGFCDTLGLTSDGELVFNGRDWSAVAYDDTAPPQNYQGIAPNLIIEEQAQERGFRDTRIATMSLIPNLYTDGSESVWAFWYRMVLRPNASGVTSNNWLWTDGNGILHAHRLNYGTRPKYFFGIPTRNSTNPNAKWINIIDCSVQKTTNTRVGSVTVYGTNGYQTFNPVTVVDPRITDWIKRPLQIITGNTQIINVQEAKTAANQQIFEGMVGTLEYLVTITDPGWVVQMNEMAYLNYPPMGISGIFFVVGNNLSGDPSNGYIQQIRLRQRQFALDSVPPTAPDFDMTSFDFPDSYLGQYVGSAGTTIDTYFVLAAYTYHGGWPFDLFLAALLSISSYVTGSQNLRSNPKKAAQSINAPFTQGPIYTPPPKGLNPNTATAGRDSRQTTDSELLQWEKDYANSGSNPLNPDAPNEAGVGFMMLISPSNKQFADSLFGQSSEYTGGRWDPRSNILTGGRWLATCLNGLDPNVEADMEIALSRYLYDQVYGTGALQKSGKGLTLFGRQVWFETQTNLKSIDSEINILQPEAQGSDWNSKIPYNTPDPIGKIINWALARVGDGWRSDCDGISPAAGHACVDATGNSVFDSAGLVYAAYQYGGGLGQSIGGHLTVAEYWNGGKSHDNLQFIAEDKFLAGDMVFMGKDPTLPPNYMGIFWYSGQFIGIEGPGKYVNNQLSVNQSGPLRCLGGMRLAGLYPTGSVAAPIQPSALGPTAPGTSAGFTSYNQCDQQWKNQNIYSLDVTICSAGCGVTCVAIVVENLNLSNPVTPADVGTLVTKNGFFVDDDMTAANIVSAIEQYGLTATSLDGSNASFAQAVSCISNGGLVIAMASDPETAPLPYTTKGHIIVLRAINKNGNFLVANPAGSQLKSPISPPDMSDTSSTAFSALTNGGYFNGIDNGMDVGGSGYSIFALGDGVIQNAQSTGSGWPGGAFLYYQLDGAAIQGNGKTYQYCYIAEDITIADGLAPGTKIKKGQILATATNATGDGIECGFCQFNGQTFGGFHVSGSPGFQWGYDFFSWVQYLSGNVIDPSGSGFPTSTLQPATNNLILVTSSSAPISGASTPQENVVQQIVTGSNLNASAFGSEFATMMVAIAYQESTLHAGDYNNDGSDDPAVGLFQDKDKSCADVIAGAQVVCYLSSAAAAQKWVINNTASGTSGRSDTVSSIYPVNQQINDAVGWVTNARPSWITGLVQATDNQIAQWAESAQGSGTYATPSGGDLSSSSTITTSPNGGFKASLDQARYLISQLQTS